MNAHWTQLTWALYGLSYIVLGVAVASRAAAFPSSTLRSRLLCLAAFSICHALYDWTILANDVTGGLLPRKLRYAIEAVSFVPLSYFATGWHGVRAHILLAGLAVTAVCGTIVALFGQDPGYLQLVVHFGLGIPACAFAALALLRDPVFRPRPGQRGTALNAAAYTLAIYGATQILLLPSDFFPATILNTAKFEALFGVSLFTVRVLLAAIFMAATLALLNRFDEAMRTESAKRHNETDKALRITEAKLADILRMSPEGIIVTDGKGRIEMFSAGAETIFGWSASEVAGRDIEILMPERFRAMHRHLVEGFARSAVAHRPRTGRPAVIGLRKNGEEFPVGASLSKIATQDGMLVTTILRDITRHRAQQEELLNAKRQAEEASTAKSRFIANMSHELRTPLNAILGFSEMLSSPDFAKRRTEYAALIHGAGEHLLTLINDILDLAKIEAGKLTLREAEFDFGAMIRGTAEMLAAKAKAGGIVFGIELARNLPQFYGDERALKQVVLNLAANALKFTPPGGKVTLFAKLDSGSRFVFGVRDTGLGISEEDQTRLFDGFGQGRQDAVTGEKGTGLGLQIAKGLALAHGGAIELQSRSGEGTTVTVTLPAERLRAMQASSTA
jgi:PAS domain S-box-containing protein